MPTRNEILALIKEDPRLCAIARETQLSTDGDPGHDFEHAVRVAVWTMRIGGAALHPRLAIIAALLHDVVNFPKNSPERARASERSATRAAELMLELGFSNAEVEEVAAAIRTHSFSRGEAPMSALGRALQDADRLEALGALGVMRTIACGTRMNARFFDSADPWASGRALDDRKFSVDHFFVKLLHLASTMNTDVGRAEAERRIAFMRMFLEQLADEIQRPIK